MKSIVNSKLLEEIEQLKKQNADLEKKQKQMAREPKKAHNLVAEAAAANETKKKANQSAKNKKAIDKGSKANMASDKKVNVLAGSKAKKKQVMTRPIDSEGENLPIKILSHRPGQKTAALNCQLGDKEPMDKPIYCVWSACPNEMAAKHERQTDQMWFLIALAEFFPRKTTISSRTKLDSAQFYFNGQT